jgi:hypothetical protein
MAASITSEAGVELLISQIREHLSRNKVKIIIGTPCYGGVLHCGYFHSMMELSSNFTKLGLRFETMIIGNESLITRARNGIVARFYADIEATHLLFIDADITFSWISVVKLILADKEISGGCYPKKMINWAKVKHHVKENPSISDDILMCKSLDYVFNPIYYQEGDKVVCKVDKGLVKVKDIGTGFMMVKKQVFYKMMKNFPELKYRNNVAGYDITNENDYFYTLFDTGIDPDSKVYLSEDYLFCKRWIGMGGELWLDLETNLNHTGVIDFKGCIGMNINSVDTLNQDAMMMARGNGKK